MLVLEREINETIRIGPDIKVMVIRIDSHRVWLGVTAPRAVQIDRIAASGRSETKPKELDNNGDRDGNR